MASRTELKFQQRLKTKPTSKPIKNEKNLDSKTNSELTDIIVSPENNEESENSDIDDTQIANEFVNEKRIIDKTTTVEEKEPIHIEVVCAQLIKKNTKILCLFCYRSIIVMISLACLLYITQIIHLLKRLQI